MKSRFFIMAAVAIAIIFVAAAGFWVRANDRAKTLAASVPDAPSLDAWPGELADRIRDCEERMRAGRDALAALEELSRLYHANGFYDQAAQCYAGLVRLDPDAVTLHRFATLLAGFGDADSALPLWERALRLAPDYVPVRFKYAELLLKQDRIDEAAAVHRNALAREPGEPYALLGLARCEFENGNWEEARRLLEQVVARTNYRLGYDLIVTVYERLGLDSRALVVRGREKASGAYRDPPDPWMDELYRDCYDAYRLSLAAGEAHGSGDTRLAIQRLERALRFSPDNVSLHFQLGGTHLAANNLTRAREHFTRCTQINPEFPDGWSQLVQLLDRVGDRAGATEALRSGIEHCPRSPGLRFLHGRRLKEAGRLDEAIESYEESIRLRPNEADAYLEIALIHYSRDDIESGAREMERALAAEPDHPVALGMLAMTAITEGDEPAARRWLARAANQPRVEPERLNALRSAYRNQFGRDWRPQ